MLFIQIINKKDHLIRWSLNEPPVGIEPTSKVYKTLVITFILRRHIWFLLDNVHGSTKKPKTIVFGVSLQHTNQRQISTEGIRSFADFRFYKFLTPTQATLSSDIRYYKLQSLQ